MLYIHRKTVIRTCHWPHSGAYKNYEIFYPVLHFELSVVHQAIHCNRKLSQLKNSYQITEIHFSGNHVCPLEEKLGNEEI